jgi:hypothetical protein
LELLAPAVEQDSSDGAAESDTFSDASTLVAHSSTPAAPAGSATQQEIVSLLVGLLPTTEPQLALIVVFLYLVSLQLRGFSWGVSAVLLLGFVFRMGWCEENLTRVWAMLGRVRGRRDPGN